MNLHQAAHDGKPQTLAFKAYHPSGDTILAFKGRLAVHVVSLIEAGKHGARVPTSNVQRMRQAGLDIAQLSAPLCAVPGLYILLTAVDFLGLE